MQRPEENSEPALIDEEIKTFRAFVKGSKILKNFNKLQKYMELDGQQDVGSRLQRWSMEKPDHNHELAARFISGGLIAAAALFTFSESVQMIQSVGELVPNLRDLMGSLASFDLSQASVPSLNPLTWVHVFDPVFLEHQQKVNLAFGGLMYSVSETIHHGGNTLIAGLGATVLTLTRHPFKPINERSSVILPTIGKILTLSSRQR